MSKATQAFLGPQAEVAFPDFSEDILPCIFWGSFSFSDAEIMGMNTMQKHLLVHGLAIFESSHGRWILYGNLD